MLPREAVEDLQAWCLWIEAGRILRRQQKIQVTGDVLQRVAKSASPEIQEIIRHNVQGLLGMLPGEQFEVKVTSSKDNLASLLASAMMTGYFLRQMEQRKQLEETLLSDEEMSVDPDKI